MRKPRARIPAKSKNNDRAARGGQSVPINTVVSHLCQPDSGKLPIVGTEARRITKISGLSFKSSKS